MTYSQVLPWLKLKIIINECDEAGEERSDDISKIAEILTDSLGGVGPCSLAHGLALLNVGLVLVAVLLLLLLRLAVAALLLLVAAVAGVAVAVAGRHHVALPPRVPLAHAGRGAAPALPARHRHRGSRHILQTKLFLVSMWLRLSKIYAFTKLFETQRKFV